MRINFNIQHNYWKFSEKNTSPKKDSQPDLVGEVEIDGKTYKLSLWSKKDKNQNLCYSCAMEEQEGDKVDKKPKETKNTYLEEDNPF